MLTLHGVADVDVNQLPKDSPIKEVDLRSNPLVPQCHEMLSKVTSVAVTLSPREREEWEDLAI